VSRLLLTGAHVVVGDGTELDNATVVVDGERIASVGAHSDGSGPAGSRQPDDRVVDLAGRTVMPGMVMCHYHATFHNPGSAPARFGVE